MDERKENAHSTEIDSEQSVPVASDSTTQACGQILRSSKFENEVLSLFRIFVRDTFVKVLTSSFGHEMKTRTLGELLPRCYTFGLHNHSSEHIDKSSFMDFRHT